MLFWLSMSSLKKGLFKTAIGTFDKAQVHFTRCGVFSLPAGFCRSASCGTLLRCCWRRKSECHFPHKCCPKWKCATVILIKKWDRLSVWLEIPILIRLIVLPYFPLSKSASRTSGSDVLLCNSYPLCQEGGRTFSFFLRNIQSWCFWHLCVWQLSVFAHLPGGEKNRIRDRSARKRWSRIFFFCAWVCKVRFHKEVCRNVAHCPCTQNVPAFHCAMMDTSHIE